MDYRKLREEIINDLMSEKNISREEAEAHYLNNKEELIEKRTNISINDLRGRSKKA